MTIIIITTNALSDEQASQVREVGPKEQELHSRVCPQTSSLNPMCSTSEFKDFTTTAIKCKFKHSQVGTEAPLCAQPLSFLLCRLPSDQLVQAHKHLQMWFTLVCLTTLFDEGGHGDPEERKAEGIHLHEGS